MACPIVHEHPESHAAASRRGQSHGDASSVSRLTPGAHTEAAAADGRSDRAEVVASRNRRGFISATLSAKASRPRGAAWRVRQPIEVRAGAQAGQRDVEAEHRSGHVPRNARQDNPASGWPRPCARISRVAARERNRGGAHVAGERRGALRIPELRGACQRQQRVAEHDVHQLVERRSDARRAAPPARALLDSSLAAFATVSRAGRGSSTPSALMSCWKSKRSPMRPARAITSRRRIEGPCAVSPSRRVRAMACRSSARSIDSRPVSRAHEFDPIRSGEARSSRYSCPSHAHGRRARGPARAAITGFDGPGGSWGMSSFHPLRHRARIAAAVVERTSGTERRDSASPARIEGSDL